VPAVDVFAGLNEPQRAAVAHVKGPALVIAGAGSGKTRVITHRIANLIQAAGIRPDRILAITFTNKAAGEMKERIERLLGLQTPWICTFHSAGYRMLRMERSRDGNESEFSICDDEEPEKYIRQIVKDLGRNPKDFEPKKLHSRISHWKNQLADLATLTPNDDFDAVCLEVAKEYARRLDAENKLDFDDLLLKPVRMLEKDVIVKRRWQERFPYILIDEYQDTNAAQYRLIRLLGEHRNVCATGDPDQAIYGWRGADINNILNFQNDFDKPSDPVTMIKLEQNYRSTQIILRAAQGVIENNTERMDKTIRTENAEGKPVTLLAVDDELDESYAIAAALARFQEKGRPWGEMAVFYRTNAMSRVLEDALRRRAVPYQLHGGTRFYDREEVKHVVAYLKLLVNPRDSGALSRIINVPKRGIGDGTYDQLTEFAAEQLVAPTEVLERPELLAQVAVGRAAGPMNDFARLWRLLKTLPLGDPPACVRGVLDLTNLGSHYSDRPAVESEDRLGNMREMITAAEQFRESDPTAGLVGFLEAVGLNAEVGNREDREAGQDRVQMMTLHAAKGLEFPIVFIAGLEEGLLPLLRGKEIEDTKLQEERRLMYVGITRAMKELYLSRARCRMLYGQTFHFQPSRFLAEIPSTCFVEKDATGRHSVPDPTPPPGSRRFAQKSTGSQAASREEAKAAVEAALDSGLIKRGSNLRPNTQVGDDIALEIDPLQPGQRILHKTLGRGTVVVLRGPHDSRIATIEFDKHGAKELQLTFAMKAITVL
jgi:DNA helicase II / ATP-dependent DNA helicase PcrA